VILGSKRTSPKTNDIISKRPGGGYTIEYDKSSTLLIDLRSRKGPTALVLSITRQLKSRESGLDPYSAI